MEINTVVAQSATDALHPIMNFSTRIPPALGDATTHADCGLLFTDLP
jgi:hypothetical protein